MFTHNYTTLQEQQYTEPSTQELLIKTSAQKDGFYCLAKFCLGISGSKTRRGRWTSGNPATSPSPRGYRKNRGRNSNCEMRTEQRANPIFNRRFYSYILFRQLDQIASAPRPMVGGPGRSFILKL